MMLPFWLKPITLAPVEPSASSGLDTYCGLSTKQKRVFAIHYTYWLRPFKKNLASWSGRTSSVVALSVVTTRELLWQFLCLEAFGLIAEGDLGHSSCKGIQFNFTYPIVTIHGLLAGEAASL